MNLEELVRAALAEETKAEPDETGAYDRFLGRRLRHAVAAATATGLGVALVLVLAIAGALAIRDRPGERAIAPVETAATTAATPTSEPPQGPVETTRPAPPPVPVSAAGVVRRERQGFELTLPKGWKVDQSTTRSYAQFGQPWLVISPGGRPVSATRDERITIYTAVTSGSEYPGKPAKDTPDLKGQSISTLAGRRSSGRRPDGRAFLAGDQGGVLGYHIAWAYRCEPADICPDAGPWRVLRLEVEGTGGQEGLKVRRVARGLVDSIRPITNALPGTGITTAEEEGLFADAPVVVGRGGQGDYAWELLARKGSDQDNWWIEIRHQDGDLWYGGAYGTPARSEQQAMRHCAPEREGATAMLVEGYGSAAVAKVRLEVEGRPPVEVPTFRKKGFPFSFWVVAPLPPDARPRSFTSFDAVGQELARGTEFAGYPNCRP